MKIKEPVDIEKPYSAVLPSMIRCEYLKENDEYEDARMYQTKRRLRTAEEKEGGRKPCKIYQL